MDSASIILGIVFVLLFLICRHLTKNRGTLEALGIPVVSPAFPLLGSPPYVYHDTHFWKIYLDNHAKLGQTYGFYDGVSPVLVTIDPDLVKSITVKNADSFGEIMDLPLPDKHLTLDMSSGEKWKSLRKHLSPTFTSGKLRAMSEPMEEVVDETMEFLEQKLKESPILDIKDIFQGLSQNVIARCAFGLKTDAHRNPDDELIKSGVDTIQGLRSTSWFGTLIFHFILHFPFVVRFINVIPAGVDKIREITKSIIRSRDRNKAKGSDFIGRIIDLIQMRDEKKKTDESLALLSDDLITVQGVIFFLAGYETVASTLASTCYILAKHPDVQEKIRDEISELKQRAESLDSVAISGMKYLDAVIYEDLRLFPPVLMQSRRCTRDCRVSPELTVPKGTRVDFPIHASHVNPDFFANPDEFEPERFFKENEDDIRPYTFRPFGSGSRICLGQRFALAEIKLALVKLLSKYRITATSDTKMDLLKGDTQLLAFSDITVKLVKLDDES